MRMLEQNPVNPTYMYLRGLQGQAYQWLGRTHAELARSASSTDARQRWQTAHEMFKRSVDIWQDLRSRGTLAADDAVKLEETLGEIAQCDAALNTSR